MNEETLKLVAFNGKIIVSEKTLPGYIKDILYMSLDNEGELKLGEVVSISHRVTYDDSGDPVFHYDEEELKIGALVLFRVNRFDYRSSFQLEALNCFVLDRYDILAILDDKVKGDTFTPLAFPPIKAGQLPEGGPDEGTDSVNLDTTEPNGN